ncbi:hypothetical protein V5799_018476 [Amblyomma americanum]|uniref:Uncharacterized protein n=1 Tax=Amblyomma americanum TaxID=6943 RepID=A0AAQ4EZM0_AMBAM
MTGAERICVWCAAPMTTVYGKVPVAGNGLSNCTREIARQDLGETDDVRRETLKKLRELIAEGQPGDVRRPGCGQCPFRHPLPQAPNFDGLSREGPSRKTRIIVENSALSRQAVETVSARESTSFVRGRLRIANGTLTSAQSTTCSELAYCMCYISFTRKSPK